VECWRIESPARWLYPLARCGSLLLLIVRDGWTV
jgi:hypothetical protein